jgi:hypothetical protein
MAIRVISVAFLLVAVPFLGAAWAKSIDDEQLDPKQIFFGDPKAFDSPAAVDIQIIIETTPEHQEIKKYKIKRGTAKYWILLSKATDRAIEAIADVAENEGYDLIAARVYLKDLKPIVTAEDVTKTVIKKIK